MSYDTMVNGVSLLDLKENILFNGYSPSQATLMDLIDGFAARESYAARYRWLRRGEYSVEFAKSVLNDTPFGIDAAIDAAMKGGA